MNSFKKISITLVILAVSVFAASQVGANLKQNRISSIKEINDDKLRSVIERDLKEKNEKGYNEVDDAQILHSENVADQLTTFEKLQENTVFAIKLPSYLPENSKLMGGFAGGPRPEGPWDSIFIVYNSPKGEFQIAETKMTNGYIILPQEFIDEKVAGQPAVTKINKGKQSGKFWNELTWTTGSNTVYGVYGELPVSELKKIAESLPVGDLGLKK